MTVRLPECAKATNVWLCFVQMPCGKHLGNMDGRCAQQIYRPKTGFEDRVSNFVVTLWFLGDDLPRPRMCQKVYRHSRQTPQCENGLVDRSLHYMPILSIHILSSDGSQDMFCISLGIRFACSSRLHSKFAELVCKDIWTKTLLSTRFSNTVPIFRQIFYEDHGFQWFSNVSYRYGAPDSPGVVGWWWSAKSRCVRATGAAVAGVTFRFNGTLAGKTWDSQVGGSHGIWWIELSN